MTDATPIKVDSSPWPRLTWQTVRVFIIAACGWIIARNTTSETVIMAEMAAVGLAVTYGYGVFMFLRDHLKMRAMEPFAPNATLK